MRALSDQAREIYEVRPDGWEFLLLAQVVTDEFTAAAPLKRDWTMRLSLKHGGLVTDVPPYLQAKLKDLMHAIQAVEKLINQALPEAQGAAGEDGDADYIVYVGQKSCEIYRFLLEWVAEVRATRVPSEWERLLRLYENLPNNVLLELEKFAQFFPDALPKVKNALKTGAPLQLNITLNATIPDMRPLEKELKAVAKRMNLPKSVIDSISLGG